MGAVYKAEQPEMNRYVAVKILHSKYLARTDLVSRFRREARAMSQLSHPNTARVFLYGQLDDGSCYFVMEYLQGRNLARTVREEGPMDPFRALDIMGQACGALEEAHEAGIIHRDLKPENIFLTTQGGIPDFPKVLDFGLAKVTEKQMRPGSLNITRDGMVFGTPEFMSPEQAQGDPLDGRADIYALGVILYEILTGKLPFDATRPMEYMELHIDAPPIPLHERAPTRPFPAGLEPVLMRALAKAPDERHPSAAAFGEDLRRVAEEGRGRTGAAWGGEEARPQRAVSSGSSSGSRASPAEDAPVDVESSERAPAPPLSRASWVVLAVGVVLAVAGVLALTLTFVGP